MRICQAADTPAIVAALTAVAASAGAIAQGDSSMEPDPTRVGEIAAMLKPEPGTFGAPIDQREVWNALGRRESFRDCVSRAEAAKETSHAR